MRKSQIKKQKQIDLSKNIVDHQSDDIIQRKKRDQLFRDVLQYLPYKEVLQLRLINREINILVESHYYKLVFNKSTVTYQQYVQIYSRFDRIYDLELPHMFTQSNILIRNAQKLKKLTVKYLPATKSEFEMFISKFKNLESLTIYYNKFINQPNAALYATLQIQEINLYKIDTISDLSIVAVNQQLTSLSFKCDIRQDNCRILLELPIVPKLIKLKIGYFGVPLADSFIDSFSQLLQLQNQLETFELQLMGLSDKNRKALLDVISRLYSIKQLGLISIKTVEIFQLQIEQELDYLLLDIDFDIMEEIAGLITYPQPRILDVSSLIHDKFSETDQYLAQLILKFHRSSVYINQASQLQHKRLRKVHPLKTVM